MSDRRDDDIVAVVSARTDPDDDVVDVTSSTALDVQ
jgi:hypothetical protein